MKRATIIAIIGIVLALFVIFRFKERLFGRPAVVAGAPSIPSTVTQTPLTTSSPAPVITSSGGTDHPVPSQPAPNREFRKTLPQTIQADRPEQQISGRSGPTIDIARTRMQILEQLDALRASRLAAESALGAALARHEQTINGTPEEIAAAHDAVEGQRARLQETEASERSAQTAADEELGRLLAEGPNEQTTTSQTNLAALRGLIADVHLRQQELEESIARRTDRDAAHDAKIAEWNRPKETKQEIVQTPPPQKRRFSSDPAPPSKVAAGTTRVPPAAERLRYSVIVDAFENKTENRTLGTEGSTLLTSELHQSGRLTVVPQTDMQLTALKKRLRGLSGISVQGPHVPGPQTADGDQIAPAQLLVRGVITRFESNSTDQGGGFGIGRFGIAAGRGKVQVRVTLQVIDARTGALIAAKNFIGNTQKRAFSTEPTEQSANMADDADVRAAFEKALSEATPWIVSQLRVVQWRGSVIKMDRDFVVINRGAREGVAVGDRLIAGKSEILRDPETGEVLDEKLHERARLRVVKVTERTSTCIALDGDSLIEGMTIWYSDNR